ncbi:uncharacterized protein LOC129749141 [Uranotaenia lowii]|uniref:uncharacterized protein LOC129749141 n=1 Tax=Uranotaenia lowii TaxID=190385 RepID=UPI002479BCA1|nr:uncharacterized protein LOC129749141 [Uranotaenia lowii]XP_055600004.1 uncharacterized protein LOC129749141 [Uranotaenia lowii]
MNLNFMLTEISLQLLGNKFYDVNGQETDNLKDLFSAQTGGTPVQPQQRSIHNGQQKRQKESDFLSQIGLPNGFDSLLEDSEQYVESQFREFIETLRDRVECMASSGEGGQPSASVGRSKWQFQTELSEMRIRSQRELVRMVSHSKQMMNLFLETLQPDADRNWESTKYKEEERHQLLNEYNSLLYVLKQILSDVDDRTQGEQFIRIIEAAKKAL